MLNIVKQRLINSIVHCATTMCAFREGEGIKGMQQTVCPRTRTWQDHSTVDGTTAYTHEVNEFLPSPHLAWPTDGRPCAGDSLLWTAQTIHSCEATTGVPCVHLLQNYKIDQ